MDKEVARGYSWWVNTPRVCALVVLSVLFASFSGARAREKTLLSDFESGKSEDRIRLASALGRMKDKKATDALLNAFDIRRSSPRETGAIIEALGETGDPRAVEPISGAEDYLRSTVQMGELSAQLQVLRGKILEALGRLGGERAVSILEESLDDKDPRVVQEAVRGLGNLQIKDAVPALQQLAGQGGDMTQAVFEAFASIGDKRAESTLEQGLFSQDKFVNVEAAYALAKLGRKEMIGRLEAEFKNDYGSERVGVLAAFYLAKMDRVSGLDHLVDLMKKPALGFSVLAAESLGKCGNPRAMLPLIEALKTDDSSMRIAVARGLGLLGGVRAVTALKKLCEDTNPGVRAAAYASLAQLGELD